MGFPHHPAKDQEMSKWMLRLNTTNGRQSVDSLEHLSSLMTHVAPVLCFLLLLVPQVLPAQVPSQGPGPDNVPGQLIQPTPEAQAKERRLITQVLEPELTLDLDPQRSKIIRTMRPVTRLSVTDPEIVEVVEFSPTEFELIGGQSGQTSLTLWFGDNQQDEILRYLVRVSPDQAIEDRRKIEYGDLERKINELFPDSVVQLIPVADKLLVRGQARDAEEATEIMAVLRGDASTSDGYYLTSVVEGTAAEPYPGVSNLPPSSVIDMLQVPGEMQVLLKVRVAELSRTALREMGTDLQMFWNDFSFFSFLGLDGPVRAVLDRDEIKLTLEAIASNSYSKILAEPNLVTLSGHPAYFIAGGEFAVPIVVGVEGAAAQTTNFRGFGTQLTFVPTVLDKDRIRLHVAPSLSSLNQANAVNGIPGLNTRGVATTVDLREGQWLAIAGLLQDEQEGSKTRVPFVGDVPYLDTLFSRKHVKRNEPELLVLVSPELVHPLEAEEAPAILPGMEVTEPTDWAFYFGGRIEGRVDCDHRSTVWPASLQQSIDGHREAKRHGSYQACESFYIEGDHGFSQ
jgi:pilus assembly protein CpaC